jgi:hypothetical protein
MRKEQSRHNVQVKFADLSCRRPPPQRPQPRPGPPRAGGGEAPAGRDHRDTERPGRGLPVVMPVDEIRVSGMGSAGGPSPTGKDSCQCQ